MTTRPASDWYKRLRISQAHLAPNMSLAKWRAILSDYLGPNEGLDALTPAQLDEIVGRIRAEVEVEA